MPKKSRTCTLALPNVGRGDEPDAAIRLLVDREPLHPKARTLPSTVRTMAFIWKGALAFGLANISVELGRAEVSTKKNAGKTVARKSGAKKTSRRRKSA